MFRSAPTWVAQNGRALLQLPRMAMCLLLSACCAAQERRFVWYGHAAARATAYGEVSGPYRLGEGGVTKSLCVFRARRVASDTVIGSPWSSPFSPQALLLFYDVCVSFGGLLKICWRWHILGSGRCAGAGAQRVDTVC